MRDNLASCDIYGENKLMVAVQKKWYAVYTSPRAEKKVYKRLNDEGIEAYLPLQKTLKQWSDRKKMVEQVLLSSYVFVHITRASYSGVLKTDGVVRYVCFEGRAAEIPEVQMNNLRLLVDSNFQFELSEKEFKPGEFVQVNLGALQGLKGELVRVGKNKRVLIRIDHIDQNMLVNIPETYLEHIN